MAPKAVSEHPPRPLLALPTTVARIVAALGGVPVGATAVGLIKVAGFGSLRQAKPDQLAFYDGPSYHRDLAVTRAAVVALPRRYAEHSSRPRIVLDNRSGRDFMAELIGLLRPPRQRPGGVDARAQVDPSAQIDPSATIGPGAVIGARAKVGPEAEIRTHAVLAANCHLGARSILFEGAVIGSEGFGFVGDPGKFRRFPHCGAVQIGTDVEIGANSCVDRGALDDTLIGNRVKIDNLVQIGHNVVIEEDCVICGAVAVAGHAIIGAGCMIGGGVRIGHVSLAARTKVIGSSVIVRNVSQPGLVVGGFMPATSQRQFGRLWRYLRNLGRSRGRRYD